MWRARRWCWCLSPSLSNILFKIGPLTGPAQWLVRLASSLQGSSCFPSLALVLLVCIALSVLVGWLECWESNSSAHTWSKYISAWAISCPSLIFWFFWDRALPCDWVSLKPTSSYICFWVLGLQVCTAKPISTESLYAALSESSISLSMNFLLNKNNNASLQNVDIMKWNDVQMSKAVTWHNCCIC